MLIHKSSLTTERLQTQVCNMFRTFLYQNTEWCKQNWLLTHVLQLFWTKAKCRNYCTGLRNKLWLKLGFLYCDTQVGLFCAQIQRKLISNESNLRPFLSQASNIVWSVSEKLHLCPGSQPLMFPALFAFLSASYKPCGRLFQFVYFSLISVIVLSSSQAGLCVHSARAEERLGLGLRFLGLWLHGTLVFLSDLLQQEHISISPLSVFTSAQRRFAQDLLYGLQIGLLRLKQDGHRIKWWFLLKLWM